MHGAGSTLAMLHLTTMALMAILIVRIGLPHLLAFGRPGYSQTGRRFLGS